MRVFSFLKNTGKGFLWGLLLVLAVFVAYIYYCFSNLIYFLPVANRLHGDLSENNAVLITLHNESELRPTLGFLTGFILLKRNEDNDITMEFHDSYDIEAPKKPIIAPDVIERNFSTDSRYQGWVFRDTNFNMQYSQNAKNAIAFLGYDKRYKNVNISAVISLDMHAIEKIIDAVGGVEFQGKILHGENFFSVLESQAKQFNRSDEIAWKNRKGSIKPLAVSIIKKCIKSIFSWKNISNTIEVLFAQRHILFYSPQVQIQKIFAEHNLTGAITLDQSNIVWGINYANIGGKKGDRYIEKSVKSTFSLDKNGKITEKMEIQFAHNGTRNLHSDRYFGYIRVVKSENVKLVGFQKNSNYINDPAVHTPSFPHTSEFDLFFYVDPSSEETLELTFKYPQNLLVGDAKKINIFTQPGLRKMPIEFVFQAFGDANISILNCEEVYFAENISSCSVIAPNAPEFISISLQKDETFPIFEDVIYKEDGKKIRLQFSEELEPVMVKDIILVEKNRKNKNIKAKNIVIRSVVNAPRAIEILLDQPLNFEKRKFYTVFIEGFSDVSGNIFEQYNIVIAYPKYK